MKCMMLAQQGSSSPYEGIERMIEHFDGGAVLDVSLLVWPVMALAAVFLTAGAWRWHRTRHLRSQPLATFHQLATGLGVGLADQWLLARIARREGLPTPLALMLSVATLRHHAQRFTERASPSRRQRVLANVARIEKVVFGEGTQGQRPADERTISVA